MQKTEIYYNFHTVSDFRNRIIVLCVFVFWSALTGCTSSYQAVSPPKIDYNGVGSVYVDVGEILFYSENTEIPDGLDISDEMYDSPRRALTEYLPSRFKATGSHGTLAMILDDISMYKKPDIVTNKKWIPSWLWTDEREVYEISVRLVLNYLPITGHSTKENHGKIELDFTRELVLPEHYSVIEREQAQTKTISRLVKNIDQTILKSLSEVLRISYAQ